jgi:hypothetical protein
LVDKKRISHVQKNEDKNKQTNALDGSHGLWLLTKHEATAVGDDVKSGLV